MLKRIMVVLVILMIMASMGTVWRFSTIPAICCKCVRTSCCVALKMIMLFLYLSFLFLFKNDGDDELVKILWIAKKMK